MAGSTADYSSALEDCLISISLGRDLEDCLTRYPQYAAELRPRLEMVLQMRQAGRSDRQQIRTDIPAGVSFNVALSHAIRMVMRGKTPEYCYTQYPEYALQLQPWLMAVVDIRENGGIGTVKQIDFPEELLTPQVSYKEALEYCLDALERGIQPEVALSRYPYYADRLRIWVYYVATLRARVDLSLHPVPAADKSLLPGFERMRSFSYSVSNFAMSLILAIVFLLGSTGLVQASQGALPNESLYLIKDAVRQIQIGLSPVIRPNAAALLEHERRGDIKLLLDKNIQDVDVHFTAQVLAVNGDSLVVEDLGTVFVNPGSQPEAFQTGMYVYIKGRTGKASISADVVEVVDAPGVIPNPPKPVSVSAPTATRIVIPSPSATRFIPSPTIRVIPPTATDLPTSLPTATFTLPPANTSTATNTPLPTFTDTALPTETATARPTNTATVTPSNTPIDTDTPTLEPTNTPTLQPTDTPTLEPTNTPTPQPTDTALPHPTSTSTDPAATPTIDPTFMP